MRTTTNEGCAYIRRHQLYRGHSGDRALRLDIAFPPNIVTPLGFRKGARDGSNVGKNLRRHRRLDLRALARGVLSRRAATGEGARLCERPADLDRGQRHVLSHPIPRHVPQMGERNAAWISVLGEGAPLCGAAWRTVGSRRLAQAIL